MSWLFIDTHERGVMRLATLPARGRIRAVRRKIAPGASIAALASFVKPAEVARVRGICVVAGPGSFSAVRSGVLAANLLARVYGKPLYGLAEDEAANLSVVRTRLAAGTVTAVPYVAPVYDAEPNITC